MARQLPVRLSSPTATGAVSSAPSGVLSRPKPTTKPRSRGVAQLAMVLLMMEYAGPSAAPNRMRMVAKPASAEPPRKARPKSPAQAVAISNTDYVTPATIQTLRGP